MFKIFVGDKPIILTTELEEETNFKNYLLSTVKLGKVVKELNRSSLEEVRLIGKKEEKLIKKFLKKMPTVLAGGGKVYNANNEILFIYRNGKWDLPKGRAEKGEDIEVTAMREVEEETGVKNLKIIKELDTTYHIFKRNGNHKIKITRWFEMSSDYEGKLNPEKTEGITKAKWLGPEKTEKAMKNSYANIQSLI